MGFDADGRGQFEVAEVGDIFGAEAHAHEFDFGDDESVATAVLAHHVLEVRQTVEVEHFVGGITFPETGIPVPVGFY